MGGKRVDIKTGFVCVLAGVRNIKNQFDLKEATL